MNIKDQSLPGDLLFYKVTPQSSLKDRIIAIIQLFRKEGKSTSYYSHVSLLNWDKNSQLEAVWPKTRASQINWNDPCLEVWRFNPPLTPNQTKNILSWANSHLNCWYDLGQVFLGLFKLSNAYSCTKFIGEDYKSIGVDLTGKAGRFIGPNELIETGMLNQII